MRTRGKRRVKEGKKKKSDRMSGLKSLAEREGWGGGEEEGKKSSPRNRICCYSKTAWGEHCTYYKTGNVTDNFSLANFNNHNFSLTFLYE